MNTLLIFDSFGEKPLRLYLIKDAPEWLKRCHQQFVNACDDEEVTDLLIRAYDAIQENPELYVNDDDELAGAWVKCKVDTDDCIAYAFIEGTFKVIICGFAP
jgi:hypothetical protein